MIAGEQKPIGSGFGAKTTAAEVLAGVDLSGKIAVVTGGYSGIGLATTQALAAAGAEVIVPARSEGKAKEAVAALEGNIKVRPMDLGDLVSVENFAADFAGDHDKLDLLINNAGIMACPETRLGNNWEAQFATNHIGHFVLTNELTPYLKNADGARVVCLSSTAQRISPIRWDDVHFTKGDYDKWTAYGQSKTANALFARELNRRLESDGVKAFSVHPGGIITPLQRFLEKEEMIALGWIDENGEVPEAARAFFKTPEQGCSTTLWCATSPQLEPYGGQYCENCDIAELAAEDAPRYYHVSEWAADDESAKRLWTMTEEMLAEA